MVLFGYVSGFKFDFNAVRSNWVNNNSVYLRIGKVDPARLKLVIKIFIALMHNELTNKSDKKLYSTPVLAAEG